MRWQTLVRRRTIRILSGCTAPIRIHRTPFERQQYHAAEQTSLPRDCQTCDLILTSRSCFARNSVRPDKDCASYCAIYEIIVVGSVVSCSYVLAVLQPSMTNHSLALDDLRRAAQSMGIEQLYDVLGYDYATEAAAAGDSKASRRTAFLRRLCLLRPPTNVELRRLFNQVNMSYAEAWALSNSRCVPAEFLRHCNHLTLYLQDKPLGLRKRQIAFGVRKDLEIRDPLRAYKALVGLLPVFLPEAITAWCEAVDTATRSRETAIALMMCLIAMHPFSDGNGRVARVAFAWLSARWSLEHKWLAEDHDGELLRTGQGLQSTEYLMTQVVVRIAADHNRGFPYATPESAAKAANATLRTLQDLDALIHTVEFKTYFSHLNDERHFRDTSPRFECLRDFMC